MIWLADNLALVLLCTLMIGLFMGFPVGSVLGGTAILVGFLGIALDVFMPVQFFNWMPRVWGGIAANYVLVAAPMFIFMGIVLERSGVAVELLHSLQVIMRRVPGGLAVSVMMMGVIMAATTGIVGASVVMLSLVALPAMLAQGYQKELSSGVVASAGTLGILLPPSIMLIILGEQLSVPVGILFAAAIIPGLVLSGIYLLYIIGIGLLRPSLAPSMAADAGPVNPGELIMLLVKSLVAPTILIVLVLGSIFVGWATPTEASGVGAMGAVLIALFKGRLDRATMKEILKSTGTTNAMVFYVLFGATLFAYVFRALGGDDVIMGMLSALNIDSAWKIFIFLNVLVFVLGFFFDWIEISLIVLPLFAPTLVSADFSAHLGESGPLYFMTWFIIVIAVNLQTSFLSPPFGVALFFLRGTVPASITMSHIYRGIVPFVLLQLLALTIMIAFPALTFWLPQAAGMIR